MNPENLYPELVTLKPGEIFVERVMVTKNFVVLKKIHYKNIIREVEESNLRRELKQQYENNEIELVTISKNIEEKEEELKTL